MCISRWVEDTYRDLVGDNIFLEWIYRLRNYIVSTLIPIRTLTSTNNYLSLSLIEGPLGRECERVVGGREWETEINVI